MFRASLDLGAKFFLRRFAEAGQFRDPTRHAGVAQLFDRTDVQLLVKRLDLFRAEPRNREQLEDGSRKVRAQFLQIFDRPGRDELFDFFGDAFADAGNLGQRFSVLQIGNIAAESLNRTRRVRVSADLERIFVPQLHQRCDLLQRLGDLILRHQFNR